MKLNLDKKTLRGGGFLIIAAVFWGSAFIAQKIAADYPFATNALRFLFGALFLLPVVLIFNKIRVKNGKDREELKKEQKNSVIGGIICGVALALATTLQQLGLTFGTTVGKSGFLTALYMVIVPVSGLFFGKKIGLNVWIAVFLAIVGAFLMSYTGDFSICTGDILTICCAFAFAINVTLVDKFVKKADGMTLSFFQLLSAGITGSVALIIVNVSKIEVLTAEAFSHIILPVLYIAIFSCCVAYTCQVLGQRDVSAAAATVIMSMESVFSVLFGAIFLKEEISLLMAIGIVLIFTAIMFAQFNPFRKKSKADGSGIDLENIEILEEKEDPSLKNDNEEDSDDK
ncbi:MAG: DMT family transporter [Candidatus Borkfalkiaceae bacterium]|nr:DMT family transporter [Christensenellaceae bacterium]